MTAPISHQYAPRALSITNLALLVALLLHGVTPGAVAVARPSEYEILRAFPDALKGVVPNIPCFENSARHQAAINRWKSMIIRNDPNAIALSDIRQWSDKKSAV
jgi:hypothetical protein